jgi:flavin reductase (DIM6/NTAB) family NADH-FMN oxidoreductase RutF|tara:strand:+ start:3931 stop:4557 length:627 start_codon:yes stop_codon:yes gene_type:complete
MFFEPGDHKAHGLPHNPFKAIVVPRPIGWISTRGTNGITNLAPYSFFNGLSDSPPVVFFSSTGPSRALGVKDSQRNAEETGEFVCNFVTWELRDKMNISSAALPFGESELEKAGLTTAPCHFVNAPRVAESPISMECRYLQTIDLPSDDPEKGNYTVLGQVLGFHIKQSALTDDGLINLAALMPLSRLGYKDYTRVTDIFPMLRPGQV